MSKKNFWLKVIIWSNIFINNFFLVWCLSNSRIELVPSFFSTIAILIFARFLIE